MTAKEWDRMFGKRKRKGSIMKVRPTGVIPPMTTPFRKDGEIDFRFVAPQVDWLIGAGSHGMAAGGSTGEGHTLDHEEYRDLVAATVEAAKGRAPVIAGIIVVPPAMRSGAADWYATWMSPRCR